MNRILVVGGGLIGIRHLEAVTAHPRCTLVGLVDPDPSIAPHVRRFADMSEVTEPVDGVILATPTHLHGQHGTYAAQRGWPMLIEKPVVQELPQASALLDAINTAGVGSLVGHHRRYHASLQQLKRLLAEGAIGQVVSASMIWAMRKPDSYFADNWRSTNGSPVLLNLVHDIDLLRFVIGEMSQIVALRGRTLRDSDRVESGTVAVAFENGAVGNMTFADTAPSPWGFEAATGENPNVGATGQDMLWITGTKGGISYPSMTLWSGQDWSQPAETRPCSPAPSPKPPLDAQLDHFLDVIGGADPLIDVGDATRTLDIALQIETQLQQQTPQH